MVAGPRTTLAQSLNAMPTGQLTDSAGWELLIQWRGPRSQRAPQYRDDVNAGGSPSVTLAAKYRWTPGAELIAWHSRGSLGVTRIRPVAASQEQTNRQVVRPLAQFWVPGAST